MILGPLAKSPPDLLSAPSSSADLPSGFERVKHFKLLGINISHDFSWQTHVDVITSKAATRLYFLKFWKIWFKPTTSLPFLLICHPPSVGVLFSGLASQSFQDSLRKSGSYTAWAIHINYPVTVGMPYIFALSYAQIPSLHCRHEDANKRFYISYYILYLIYYISCILSLLPPQKNYYF